MPRRHTVLAYPIQDASAAWALAPMLGHTAELFAEGPGSISPNIYWWRDGELRHIPHVTVGDDTQIEAPEDLGEVLSSLPPAT